MNELYRHRSFPDPGSHAFYRTVAYVAYGKDAGNIGFEQERIPVERPALGTLPVTDKIRTSQQETALVPLDDIRQPICPRRRPNKYEHRAGGHALRFVGIGTQNGDFLQMSCSVRLDHAGMAP